MFLMVANWGRWGCKIGRRAGRRAQDENAFVAAFSRLKIKIPD